MWLTRLNHLPIRKIPQILQSVSGLFLSNWRRAFTIPVVTTTNIVAQDIG